MSELQTGYILITVIQNIHFVIFLYIRCEKRIKYYEPNMLQVQFINTHFDLAAFVLGYGPFHSGHHITFFTNENEAGEGRTVQFLLLKISLYITRNISMETINDYDHLKKKNL